MTLALAQPLGIPALASEESLVGIPWRYRALIRKIRDLEARLTGLSDVQLRQYVERIRTALRDGATFDEHLPPVFAAVSVAARRFLGLRPYNVQLIGGFELHRGCIAEMATGEGKTLVATLPAALNGLTGRGVHVVTVNDYLAQRDAELLTPVYAALGLTVGVIVSGLSDDARRNAYRCDIVYGTNKEFGFDFLRDQIKLHQQSTQQRIDTATLLNRRTNTAPVMRQLNFALVDEADSILIDESRTPLIIAGPSEPSPLAWAYEWAADLAHRLRPRHDFELKTERRSLEWKPEGLQRLLKILAGTATPSITGESWQNLVLNALRARWLFIREQHYVLCEQDVVIVDEFTGRRMPGRTWSDGLHQAVQAKEKLPINTPANTLARTTYQHFFGLYQKLSGMTGTAATERTEFRTVYSLRVKRIPTHRPVRRTREADCIYRTTREKWLAVADEIVRTIRLGRPVLVGTHSIEDSEALAQVLTARGIPHEVLNARPEHAAREADIVARAGQLGAVTIATNMAGRGTDIKLGPGVATLGGLHVIGTQRHESRRVDNQLVGRCGRHGDPGSAVFMLALQDPILQHLLNRRRLAKLRRRLRGAWGREVSNRWTRWLFARAQHRIEALHYRQRQQLMEYEDWLNKVYYQMGGA